MNLLCWSYAVVVFVGVRIRCFLAELPNSTPRPTLHLTPYAHHLAHCALRFVFQIIFGVSTIFHHFTLPRTLGLICRHLVCASINFPNFAIAFAIMIHIAILGISFAFEYHLNNICVAQTEMFGQSLRSTDGEREGDMIIIIAEGYSNLWSL